MGSLSSLRTSGLQYANPRPCGGFLEYNRVDHAAQLRSRKSEPPARRAGALSQLGAFAAASIESTSGGLRLSKLPPSAAYITTCLGRGSNDGEPCRSSSWSVS